MKILHIPLVIVLGVLTGRTFDAGAQTETNLYSLVGSPYDGEFPQAELVQGSDGNFYGTTSAGGTSTNCPPLGCGTVFRISPSGTCSNLYSFAGPPTDGANPYAGLVQGSDGNFYGTTSAGGTNGGGIVFRISPSGSETNLHSFSSLAPRSLNNGAYPVAKLVQGSDGNLYGTTQLGGSSGGGTVFRISPSGSYTNLYSFFESPGSPPRDGASPQAGLVQGSDGNLYGTTAFRGTSTNCILGCGTVFRISSSGTYTNLYSFVGPPQRWIRTISRASAGQ